MSARVVLVLPSCAEDGRCVLGRLLFVLGVSLIIFFLLRWLLIVGASSAEPVSDGVGELYTLRDNGEFGAVFPVFGIDFGKRSMGRPT